MLYFKHQELVDKYHVSLKTVHNWIDAAKQGKLEIELHEQGTRTYIANTPSNATKLQQLADQGKKYRNTKHHEVVSPKPEFYSLYTRRQVLDIISSLTIHREIPRKYNYMDGGATNWDKFAERMWKEDLPNLLKSTIDLLHANLGAFDLLLEGYERVNIIDIGVGNGLPAKELLEHLLGRKILHRYIAIDISSSMLHIAKRNINEWFGDKVKFEGYVRDITYERLDDLLVDDMLDNSGDRTLNLVLFLGATLTNFRSMADSLNAICGSMGDGDLLVYTDKPDTEASRRYFEFSRTDDPNKLAPNHRFILDLMNIDEGLYDAETGFDQKRRMRYVRIRLKKSLTIKFRFEEAERGVSLEKGSAILLLRVWHMNALEIISKFEDAGFKLLQSSMTKDREYILTISGVNTKADVIQ